MQVLITGAAGFIGYHIAQRLLADGIEVYGIDNLNDYYDVNLKRDRLAQLKDESGFVFQQMELSDRPKIADLFATQSFNAVVNLAAQAGVRYDDIVEGLVRVLRRPPVQENTTNQPNSVPYRLYNIGNHHPVALLRFIEVIETALGKTAQKNFLPMQPGDVPITYADVDGLRQDVDFQPNTSLEVGIDRFIDWYCSYYT